jgi:phosphoribosylformylglycinamidine synthase
LSDGGLALAAFTLAEAGGVGVTIDVEGTAALFGEDQGRYLLAVTIDAAKAAGLITAAHDLSDGGLAVAAAEMALAAGTGAAVEANGDLSPLPWFFGEDQARYLLAAREESLTALVRLALDAGIPIRRAGRMGGAVVRLGGFEVAFDALAEAHRTGFARLMGEED